MAELKNSNVKSDILKITIACSITMLAVSTVFMTQPIFLEISKSFEIDITQARFSFSVVSLFYAVSFFIIGPAVDKYALPKVAIIGLISLSSMILFASYTVNFDHFSIIMGLMGFCAALIPASMFPYVAANAQPEKMGMFVGGIVASATLGIVWGRVSMGILTSMAGWRLSFRIYAIILILFLLAAFIVMGKNNYNQKRNNESILRLYKNSIKLIVSPHIVSLLLAGFSLFFGFLGMVTFLTFRLINPPFNFSAGEVGWISFAGLTAIIAPFSGSISHKVGVLKIIYPGLLICLLSLQLMGWFESIFLTIGGVLILFLGVYFCQPLIFLLIGQNVSKESIGSASSLYILFCIGGGSLSSITLGAVWSRFGWSGITIVSTISILISMLLMTIPRIIKFYD